ncbi:hypothetical protein JD844_019286, partial [Phrynosoma platyrhinos]
EIHLNTLFFDQQNTSLTGQVYLEEVKSGDYLGKVSGSLAIKKFQLGLEMSNIGGIKVMHLETLLKLFIPLTLSTVNRDLKTGVLLPNIGGASVMNPKVTMHEVGGLHANSDRPAFSAPSDVHLKAKYGRVSFRNGHLGSDRMTYDGAEKS